MSIKSGRASDQLRYVFLVAMLTGLIATACSMNTDVSEIAEPTLSVSSPTATPIAQNIPENVAKVSPLGLCGSPTTLAVSVGDSWTLKGSIGATGNSPGNIPFGVTGVETRYEVIGIEGTSIIVRVTSILIDSNGDTVQSNETQRFADALDIGNLSPVVALDWECHNRIWYNAWSANQPGREAEPEPSVGERQLELGLDVVVFSVKEVSDVQTIGLRQNSQRVFGYDKLTGRLVLTETHLEGISRGQPFSMDIVQALVQD